MPFDTGSLPHFFPSYYQQPIATTTKHTETAKAATTIPKTMTITKRRKANLCHKTDRHRELNFYFSIEIGNQTNFR